MVSLHTEHIIGAKHLVVMSVVVPCFCSCSSVFMKFACGEIRVSGLCLQSCDPVDAIGLLN